MLQAVAGDADEPYAHRHRRIPAAVDDPVEVGGRQKFVRPGDEVADHTIVSIERDHLIVEVEGARKRMELADPDRSSLNSIERFRRDSSRAAAQQRLRDQRARTQPIQPDRDR